MADCSFCQKFKYKPHLTACGKCLCKPCVDRLKHCPCGKGCIIIFNAELDHMLKTLHLEAYQAFERTISPEAWLEANAPHVKFQYSDGFPIPEIMQLLQDVQPLFQIKSLADEEVHRVLKLVGVAITARRSTYCFRLFQHNSSLGGMDFKVYRGLNFNWPDLCFSIIYPI